MTTIELLKPRLILENKYPHCPYEVDEILYEYDYGNGNTYFALKDGALPLDVKNPKEFPYIFRSLNWYEHRKPEEMPMYVKYIGTGNISKLTAGMIEYGGAVLEDYQPATEEETNNQTPKP